MTVDDIQHIDMGDENRYYLRYFIDKLGYIPNLIASMMHSKNALAGYYPFHERRSSLSKLEIEAITLSVSSAHKANYCIDLHTMITRLVGLNDQQIEEIKLGEVTFDHRLDIMIKLAADLVHRPTSMDPARLASFFECGFTKEHLVDMVLVIGDCIMTNITGNIFNIPADIAQLNDFKNSRYERQII